MSEERNVSVEMTEREWNHIYLEYNEWRHDKECEICSKLDDQLEKIAVEKSYRRIMGGTT